MAVAAPLAAEPTGSLSDAAAPSADSARQRAGAAAWYALGVLVVATVLSAADNIPARSQC